MPEVSEYETLEFTNANQAEAEEPLSEPYPNGTIVELSCSDGQRTVG